MRSTFSTERRITSTSADVPGRSERANSTSSKSTSTSSVRFCSWMSWTYGATRLTCPLNDRFGYGSRVTSAGWLGWIFPVSTSSRGALT